MRVLQLGNLDVKYGGPALSLSLIMRGLKDHGVETECLMKRVFEKDDIIDKNLRVHYLQQSSYLPLQSVLIGNESIFNLISSFDLLHVHGLWGNPTSYSAKCAKRSGKPYIISPRGTLYPQALAFHKWKKKLAMAVMINKALRQATCIHATCVEERDFYWELGFKNPVAILPNAFDTTQITFHHSSRKDKFRVGFLGRLHPRKHVERLIYAFSEMRELLNNAELVIIGSDVKEYEDFLKSEVKRLHLDNVIFMGFLSGEKKDAAIRSLSVLAMPSDFENFGNVVPDALARGVPVISSKGAPWQSLEINKCGWWVDNDQDTINKTLKDAIQKTPKELEQMGENGIQYVNRELSYTVLGKKMKELYNWAITKENCPDFVYFR